MRSDISSVPTRCSWTDKTRLSDVEHFESFTSTATDLSVDVAARTGPDGGAGNTLGRTSFVASVSSGLMAAAIVGHARDVFRVGLFGGMIALIALWAL